VNIQTFTGKIYSQQKSCQLPILTNTMWDTKSFEVLCFLSIWFPSTAVMTKQKLQRAQNVDTQFSRHFDFSSCCTVNGAELWRQHPLMYIHTQDNSSTTKYLHCYNGTRMVPSTYCLPCPNKCLNALMCSYFDYHNGSWYLDPQHMVIQNQQVTKIND